MNRLKLKNLASTCARHPWRTLGVWVVVLLAAALLNVTLLSGALTTTGSFTNNPESSQAQTLLQERLAGPERLTELVIVRSEAMTVDDPAFAAQLTKLAGQLTALGPGVVQSAFTYQQIGDRGLVSKDRHAALIPVTLAGNLDEGMSHVDPVIDLVETANGQDGYQVLVAGGASIGKDFMSIAESDAKTGESVGIGVALLILVLVFGALVAAAVPVLLAALSVLAALGMVALLGQAWDLTFTITNIVTMMGLAVGIDYSLFIVSRFNEERRKGLPKLEAVVHAQATAGRAVLFSGITVIVALSGMFLMPSTVFRSLAAGAVLVVGSAILAALTLLPAVLGLLGDRVNAVQPARLVRGLTRRVRRTPSVAGSTATATGSHGFWDRLTHAVMARPVMSLILATLPLLLAAGFYFQLNPGSSGASTLPDTAETKSAFTTLEKDFSFGLLSPVQVVVDGDMNNPAVQQAVVKLQDTVSRDKAFAGGGSVQTSPRGDLALVTLSLTVDPNSEAAEEAVRRLRSNHIPAAFLAAPAAALVGGPTALNVDFFDIVDKYTPWVFAFVLGLSFLLLTMVFRSLVVPAKAILMNLLSVGSAYGLLVLVFQKGIGADLLGFQRTPRIEAWLPLFLFTILFGLSMDYHVLLLSRIRERYDETGDNTESVAFGLRSTAGLITGAAVIMVAVFGGFAAGDLVMFQQMGFGLAVAVLVDATIVRSILVPAAMKLLGDRNWWLPRPLRWLPNLSVEAPARQTPAYGEQTR